MVRRNAVCFMALAVTTAGAVAALDAHASVSIQVGWDALLHESSAAVLATPIEARGVWENGRIYTYTHLRVDRSLAGELATGGDPWVRTMGGVVGKIGQIVDGEAVLGAGQTSLLFLHPGPPGAYVVTARGQGQFPLAPDTDPKAPPHLMRSSAVGALVPHPGPSGGGPVAPAPLAAEFVQGRLVDDVARDIAAAWDRTHLR